jgi:RHS repeat-associated protein
MKQVIYLAFFVFSSEFCFSQQIGGLERGQSAPTTAKPIIEYTTLSNGSVDMHTGTYNHSIELGAVSTPSGTKFELSLQNNSVGVTSELVTTDGSIPYGEGWSINIPQIRFEYNTLDPVLASNREYCNEDILEWYKSTINSIHISLPGIYNGPLTIKTIENDGNKLVLVPTSFSKYFEVKYQLSTAYEIDPIATVYLGNGVVYELGARISNFKNPANLLVTNPIGGNPKAPWNYQRNPELFYTPISRDHTFYLKRIYNKNAHPAERIEFNYEFIGKLNHYAEQSQYLSEKNYSSVTELILKDITSYDGSDIIYQQLKLNYEIDNDYKIDLAKYNIRFIDSHYVAKTIWGEGNETSHVDALGYQKSNVINTFGPNWKFIHHASTVAANQNYWSDNHVNWGATNPYIFNIHGTNYQSVENLSSATPQNKLIFSHAYAERTKIPVHLFKRGKTYEILTKVYKPGRSIDYDHLFSTFDIDLSYSSDESYHTRGGEITSVVNPFGISGRLFSTFQRPIKWIAINKTLRYNKILGDVVMKDYTQNYFVMPLDYGGANGRFADFPDFYLRIGPGNSDHVYNMTYNWNSNYPTHHSAHAAPVNGAGGSSLGYSKAASYAKLYENQTSVYSAHPYGPNNCFASCRPCMFEALPNNFGVGIEANMAYGYHYPYRFSNTPYLFSHRKDKDYNKPTIAIDLTIERVEINLIEKMPRMLKSVEFYDFNTANYLYDRNPISKVYKPSTSLLASSLKTPNFIHSDSNLVRKILFDYKAKGIQVKSKYPQTIGSHSIDKYCLTRVQTVDFRNNVNQTEDFDYTIVSSSQNYFTSPEFIRNGNPNNQTFVLSKITNMLGKVTTIDYKSTEQYETIDREATQFTNTVAKITESTAANTTTSKVTDYIFTNLQKTNYGNRIKYGYQVAEVRYPINNITNKRKKTIYNFYNCSQCWNTTHRYHYLYANKSSLWGKIIKESDYNEDGQEISRIENEYAVETAFKNYTKRKKNQDPICSYIDNGMAESVKETNGFRIWNILNYFQNVKTELSLDPDENIFFVKLKSKKNYTRFLNKAGSLDWNVEQEDYDYYQADSNGVSQSEALDIINYFKTHNKNIYNIEPSWNLYKKTKFNLNNPNHKVSEEIFYLHDYLNTFTNCEGFLDFYMTEDKWTPEWMRCDLQSAVLNYNLYHMPIEKRISYINIGQDTVRKSEYYGYELIQNPLNTRDNLSRLPVTDRTINTKEITLKCPQYTQQQRDSFENAERQRNYDKEFARITNAGCMQLGMNLIIDGKIIKGNSSPPFTFVPPNIRYINPCEYYSFNTKLNAWTVCPCLNPKINKLSDVVKSSGLNYITIDKLIGVASPHPNPNPNLTVVNNPSEKDVLTYYDMTAQEQVFLGNKKINASSVHVGKLEPFFNENNTQKPILIEDKINHKLFILNNDVFEDPEKLKYSSGEMAYTDEQMGNIKAHYNSLLETYYGHTIFDLREWIQQVDESEFYATFNNNDIGNEDPQPMLPTKCNLNSWYALNPKMISEKIDDIIINNKIGGGPGHQTIGKYENRNHINRPGGLGEIQAPFHAVTHRQILSWTDHNHIDREMDAKGLITKYYYDKSFFQQYCNSIVCLNLSNTPVNQSACHWGIRFDSRHLPYRITQGYGRHDSIGTNIFYNDDATIQSTKTDFGLDIQYHYDIFNRLQSIEQNNQLTTAYNYSLWDRTQKATEDDITNQNYIQTNTRFYKNTNDGLSSTSFIDPFGRKLGNLTAPSDITVPVTQVKGIMSGYQELDYEDKPIKSYKPFFVSGNLEIYRNTNPNLLAPQEYQTITYDFKSEKDKLYDFGIPTTSANYSQSKTTLETGTTLKTEIPLNINEIALLSIDDQEKYFRTESRDPDNKKVISYSYLNGKKIADAVLMGSSSSQSLVTLYHYDLKWDLKRVIDPNKLETNYRTNLQGLVFQKQSPDKGTNRYYYDELGSMVAMQDQNLFNQNASRVRLWTYDHFGRNLMQLIATYDPAKLIANPTEPDPGCGTAYDNGMNDNNNASGSGTGSSSSNTGNETNGRYRMPMLERLKSLMNLTADYADPNNPTLSIQNTYGQSYFWLPNQNILDEDIDGKPTIFDCLKDVNVEKHFVYNDLDPKYVTTTDRKPNQNALYLKKLTEIKQRIPSDIAAGIQSAKQYSLGKPCLATSFDENGIVNEITSTTYHKDQYPIENWKYAKFLNFPPERFLIRYSDHMLSGVPRTTMFYKISPLSPQLIYGQTQTMDAYGSLGDLSIATAANPNFTPLAAYSYDANSRKPIQTFLSALNASIAYSYDLRERLTEIGSPYFSEKLYYDNQFPIAAFGTNVANYNGNINAVETNFDGCALPGVFQSPLIYKYLYDPANRLQAATTDAHIQIGSTISAGFGSQTFAYQPNGNLAHYQTIILNSSPTSSIPQDFFYTYFSGNNRLHSITSTANGIPPVFNQTANNRTFTYDWNGNLKSDLYRLNMMTHGRADLPYSIVRGQNTTRFGYNTSDARIFKGDQTNARYYIPGIGSYDLSSKTWEHYPAGIAQVRDNVLNYTIKDHLTNTRAIVGTTSSCTTPSTITAYDYYPYGKILRKHESVASRYKSTNHEKDDETGYDDRNARMYDDEALRFVQVDPMLEQSREAYIYTGNNPIRYLDVTGKIKGDFYDRKGNYLGNDGINDGKVYLMNENIRPKLENKSVNWNGTLSDAHSTNIKNNSTKLEGLIIQDRFEQGTDYTVSRFKTVGGSKNVDGFILEPSGPATTISNQNKRIPEGIYNIDNYSSKKYPNNFILSNENVSMDRKILYHSGSFPENTKGCNMPGTKNEGGWISGSKIKMRELREFINSEGVNNIKTIINEKIENQISK